MILVIDNYDSFTFNLVQYLEMLGQNVQVFRNDTIGISDIGAMKPDRIVISPGPGRPENSGVSVDLIREFYREIPIFGVCLGAQAIGYAFGGRIVAAPELMHGKVSMVYHDGSPLYSGIDSPFPATRYHSLIVDRETLPDCLGINAWSKDNLIMGLFHKDHPVLGVQFHPESIMTEDGLKLLHNFIEKFTNEIKD